MSGAQIHSHELDSARTDLELDKEWNALIKDRQERLVTA